MTAIAAPGRVVANMFAKGSSFAVEKGAQLVMVVIAGRELGAAAFGRFSFASTTAAPSRASRSAMLRPIPRPAPVTSAALPSRALPAVMPPPSAGRSAWR